MAGTVIITLYQDKVQVDEKFRIDATKTFLHPGDANISSITIQPEASGDTYTVTSDKYLDYAYSTEGNKTITVTLNHTGQAGSVTKTATIEVVTAVSENLFSSDADIIAHEPDILNYLPEYKSDYRYAHRLAQEYLLSQLDARGITDNQGNRIVAADVKDTEECRNWSRYLALQFIMESLSNAIDDIFYEKSLRYKQLADKASNRAFLRLDYDGDGTLESTERGTVSVGRIVRR